MAAHAKRGQTVLAKSDNNSKQLADGHIDVLTGCKKNAALKNYHRIKTG